ncbi:hypothetical protein QWZ13_14160 [Reinekea marina]|uniref:hypothetical protein n=1 Tax=Reinekea marina TaxID=1310421 RepID=UPI0025B53B0E|nr:hypothetical protein [Reinekea marina]MDN3650060.1 hypothetical protein [Reinekea marina]
MSTILRTIDYYLRFRNQFIKCVPVVHLMPSNAFVSCVLVGVEFWGKVAKPPQNGA